MLRKMILDMTTIYYQALNLFPYWTDTLLKEWDKHYTDLMMTVTKDTSLNDFYQGLMRFVSILDDGHSLIYLPKQIKEKTSYFPFKLEIIEDKLVIVACTSDYKPYLFEPIKEINGMAADAFLDLLCAHYWQSNVSLSLIYFQHNPSFLFSEDPFTITFEGNDTIACRFLRTQIQWADFPVDESMIAGQLLFNSPHLLMIKIQNKHIVKIKDFMDQKLVETFYQHLPILQESQEIIFDIRGNLGGNSGFANEIAQAFFDDPLHTEKVAYQESNAERYADTTQALYHHTEDDYRNHEQFIYLNHQFLIEKDAFDSYAHRQGVLKDKKVKLLIDRQTYSSAENFAMLFDQNERALIIGEPSAGSTGQPALIKLQTGGIFMVTAKKVTHPNGKTHHNVGILPQVTLKRTLADKNKDDVLKKALALILD